MFTLDLSPSYSWPVSVSLPDDNGQYKEHAFNAKFKRMKQSEIESMLEAEGMTDRKVAEQVMVGWSDVSANGAAVDYSPEAAGVLLDIPGVPSAITRAFLDSVTGSGRKN